MLITGAIGDFGRYLNIDRNGKADPNGNYVKIILSKGAFEANSTVLNAASNKAQPTFNTTTCSGSLSVTAPNPLLNGTGLYKGITGTVNVTLTFAFVGPRYTSGPKKGQCNGGNNVPPLAQYGSISGIGMVSFR